MKTSTAKFAGLIILGTFGGCIAADPLENRRIRNFCKSIPPNTQITNVEKSAEKMIGTNLRKDKDSGLIAVQSKMASYKICLIYEKNGLVTETKFVNN